MSTKYKRSSDVPAAELASRLTMRKPCYTFETEHRNHFLIFYQTPNELFAETVSRPRVIERAQQVFDEETQKFLVA